MLPEPLSANRGCATRDRERREIAGQRIVERHPRRATFELDARRYRVDRSLAVNTVGQNSSGAVPNTVRLFGQINLGSRASIVIDYPNQLSDLSESFRPDLAGTVLIDVQGNIQSVRGSDATGLVLNNAGNLNLVAFRRMSNSTIIGEPVGHVRITKRDNVSISSTARTVGGRHVAVPYREDWQPLRDEGFAAYLRRVSGPYSRAIADRFDPSQPSLTERGLTKLRSRGAEHDEGASEQQSLNA